MPWERGSDAAAAAAAFGMLACMQRHGSRLAGPCLRTAHWHPPPPCFPAPLPFAAGCAQGGRAHRGGGARDQAVRGRGESVEAAACQCACALQCCARALLWPGAIPPPRVLIHALPPPHPPPPAATTAARRRSQRSSPRSAAGLACGEWRQCCEAAGGHMACPRRQRLERRAAQKRGAAAGAFSAERIRMIAPFMIRITQPTVGSHGARSLLLVAACASLSAKFASPPLGPVFIPFGALPCAAAL